MAILVLNAGWGCFAPFLKLRDQELSDIVTINAVHVSYFAKVMVSQLSARSKRSGLVVTSSGLACLPVPGTLAYSAAKSFSSYIAEGLHYELKDKNVDVLSYQAGEVVTKLVRKTKTDSRTILPSEAAKVCFRDLGYESMTYGAARHDYAMMWKDIIPRRWISALMYYAGDKAIERRRKEEAAEAAKEKKI